MLELIASLLFALSVALGGQGIGTVSDHASPDGNSKAIDAIEAIITRESAAVVEAQQAAGQKPETTGLDRATDVANDHAAAGLEKANAASDNAGSAAGQAPVTDTPPVAAPPVDTPPVDVPAADGPPVSQPPVAAPPVDTPPVPAPPVDAPGRATDHSRDL